MRFGVGGNRLVLSSLRATLAATLCVVLWACSPPAAPAKETHTAKVAPTSTVFPPDSPEAAVQTLMETDFSGQRRSYYPLWEKYISDNDTLGHEFSNCGSVVIVAGYRVLGGRYAAGKVAERGAEANPTYLVQVEVEPVVVFSGLTFSGEEVRPNTQYSEYAEIPCTWTSLEVMHAKTGAVELHRHIKNRKARREFIHGFGDAHPDVKTFILIDPDRRRWRFEVPLVREAKGWVFERPYLPVHTGIEAELRFYEDVVRTANGLLRACAGEGEPPAGYPDFDSSIDCTPLRFDRRKENLLEFNASIALLRSLRVQHSETKK